jgi:hypothetical protein
MRPKDIDAASAAEAAPSLNKLKVKKARRLLD